MIPWMLAHIVCHEFEKVVGKNQYESRKAMHIGFGTRTGDNTDQYQIRHLYIYAPANYVHVATQFERIDDEGKRHISTMEHLCYHDSCWRDAVQNFIFKYRDEMNVFRSFDHLFDWYDVLTLTEAEAEYLSLLDQSRHTSNFGSEREKAALAEKMKVNPFDKRSIWKDLV